VRASGAVLVLKVGLFGPGFWPKRSAHLKGGKALWRGRASEIQRSRGSPRRALRALPAFE